MHHKQNCDGRLDKTYGEGSDDLETLELEANEAGYLVREFEDSRKDIPDSSINEISATQFKTGGKIVRGKSTQEIKKMLKDRLSKRLWTKLRQKWKKGEMPFLKDEKSFKKWALETGLPSIEAQMRAREMTKASHAMAFAQILDVVGVIPGYGEFADVTSAAIKYNYAQMVERSDGFDKALIYYIDAAISLAAATVAGEILKIMSRSLALIGRKGVSGAVWALSNARGVPPELIIQDLKDNLKTIGQKIGNRFSKSRLASSRLARQLDVVAARLKQTRIARSALAKLSAKDIEKMSAKEFLEFVATNPMTRDRFKQAVGASLKASPELAEVLFKRRLKYFYDMPNTKNNLMSSELAEEVLENLDLPLEEITKLLSKVTEKEADNIYAFLDFLLVANKKGVVGVSKLATEFGSKLLNSKSGSEVADIALDMHSREFSYVFETLVSVPGKAQDIFNRMLISGGFKDIFEEALKKALKKADELILKIENGSLRLSDEAFVQQMNRLSPEYIIAQLFRPKSKLTQGMQETAVKSILDLTKKRKGVIVLDNLMFYLFPRIKAFVTKTAPFLGAFTSKNFLGRRYLTDGLPVNYGGKVIGGTAAKFLETTSYVPVAGWLFRPFRFRSARQAIEAAVGATIASAITYNRFFKVLYPEIPGGGGTEGVGDEPPISAGQQAAADEARKGVEKSNDVITRNGKKYKIMPSNSASFQPPNVKKEVEKVQKEVEKSDLPPEVKEEVNNTLEEIKKNPEALRKITRTQQAKARNNIKNVERKIPKAAAPKGMPDAKGKGLKNVEATADKGKGVPGGGEGAGAGTGVGAGIRDGSDVEGFLKTYLEKRIAGKSPPWMQQLDKKVGDKIYEIYNNLSKEGKYVSALNDTLETDPQLWLFGDKLGADKNNPFFGLGNIKDLDKNKALDFLNSPVVKNLEPVKQLKESIEQYRNKALNERYEKLLKGFIKEGK
jgi:hypothetical protein